MAETVILYTTPNCSACDRARADLLAEGVELEERDVMKKQQWYDEATSMNISVPIVIRDGKKSFGWKGDYGCAII